MNLTKIAAMALCLACSAWAADGDHGGFRSALIGSTPGTTVGGVNSAGAPWVASGHTSVSASGRLHLKVTGLLIAAGPGIPPSVVGTVGSVTMVAASLVCGGSGGSVAASSDGAPLSSAGDAEIDTTVTLPTTCMAPAVLIRIFRSTQPAGSQLGPFIGLSGLDAAPAMSASDNDN